MIKVREKCSYSTQIRDETLKTILDGALARVRVRKKFDKVRLD